MPAPFVFASLSSSHMDRYRRRPGRRVPSTPQLTVSIEPWRAYYGAAATSESLDECGAAFAELFPHVVRLAQEQIAVERLSVAMRKTTKLLNALQKVVLPRIEKNIRAIVEGIEEDERDDAIRRRVGLTLPPAEENQQQRSDDREHGDCRDESVCIR